MTFSIKTVPVIAAIFTTTLMFGANAQAAQFGHGPTVQKVKTCVNKHSAGGIRCTTCTYSTSGHTTVHCIKIKRKSTRSNTGGQSFAQ